MLNENQKAMLIAQARGGDVVAQALLDASTEAAGQERIAVITTPAAKGTTNVAVALAANAAGPFVIGGQPDVPRNLRVVFAASWDGGNITITGTDQFDAPQTETINSAPATTAVGAKIFKTVTGATKSAVGATANTASIGTGDKLGLVSNDRRPLANQFMDCLDASFAVITTTPDVANSAFTPGTVPTGAITYSVLFRVTD